MTIPRNVALMGWWLALVALGSGLLIAPAIGSIRSLLRESVELRDRLSRDDDGEAALGRLESRLTLTADQVLTRVTPIPTESDVAGLIRDLTALLDRLGVSSREITTGAPVTMNGARSMPMSVRLTGDFPAVRALVQYVESLPRLVRVQRLDVQLAPQAVDRSVRADLTLDVFFAPGESGASS